MNLRANSDSQSAGAGSRGNVHRVDNTIFERNPTFLFVILKSNFWGQVSFLYALQPQCIMKARKQRLSSYTETIAFLPNRHHMGSTCPKPMLQYLSTTCKQPLAVLTHPTVQWSTLTLAYPTAQLSTTPLLFGNLFGRGPARVSH
jgi:hypothetical protein